MHLGGTARRIALTAAQCYSFIFKYKKLTIRYYVLRLPQTVADLVHTAARHATQPSSSVVSGGVNLATEHKHSLLS